MHESSEPGLSPGSSGELVTTDGRRWRARRRNADLRIVDRLVAKPEVPFVIGLAGGFDRVLVGPDERARIWSDLRPRFAGPGARRAPAEGPEYTAIWFVDDAQDQLIYLEEHC